MVKTITISEMRRRFFEVIDEVEHKNVTYSVLKYGKEYARIIPPINSNAQPSLDADKEKKQ